MTLTEMEIFSYSFPEARASEMTTHAWVSFVREDGMGGVRHKQLTPALSTTGFGAFDQSSRP